MAPIVPTTLDATIITMNKETATGGDLAMYSVDGTEPVDITSIRHDEFDEQLQGLSCDAMHSRTLRFKSLHLEAVFHAMQLNKFLYSFRGTVPLSIVWILLVGVPILLAAEGRGVDAPISTAVLVASLSVALLLSLYVFLVPKHLLQKYWNGVVFLSGALMVLPVFILLAVCVVDGVGSDMDACTPDFPDQQPLLPVVTAIIAPLLLIPTTGCSWWIATVLSTLYCAIGTACMFVGNVPAPVAWVAGGIMFISIPMVTNMAFLIERQLRSAVWLRVMNVRGAVVLAQTEEKRKDASARNDAFTTFAASSGQLLYELDGHNKFVGVSGALEAFGITHATIIGHAHDYNVHHEDKSSVLAALHAVRERTLPGRACVLQFRRVRDQNTTIWVEMVAVLEARSQGCSLIASERDVTAEREARDAVVLERQRRIAATAAQAAHDETLGYACHELRNPLHVIQASLALLKDTMLDEDQEEHVSGIDNAARQMHTLVDDVLDVDRLRAGKLSIQAKPTDVTALVKSAATLHRDFARVPISADVGPGIPASVMVAGDRITQVLNNGLTNAAKFTSKGRICVRVCLGDQPHTLRFEVRNSGVLPNRPMFRAFDSTAASAIAEHNGSAVKGTGLGLRISISLVAALGGELNLENLPILATLPDVPAAATETVFWFQIPFSEADDPVALQRASAASSASTAPNSLGLHILFVDDEPMNRRVGQAMLKKLGCTSVLLEDGDQVLAAHPDNFDAIFMDIVMQRQHGDETMRQLQAAGIRTPCFAVSGNTDHASVQGYLRAGFRDVLGKPFTVEQLKETLLPFVHGSGRIPGQLA